MSDPKDASKYTNALIPAIFFLLVFLYYLAPINAGDFWWHLNTGRWIWDNGSLPSVDPFTYTVPHDDDLRRTLILKGYWLAQLCIYHAYNIFGFKGLIFMKASVFTLVSFLTWRLLRTFGLNRFIALALVYLPLTSMHLFEAVRPQILSLLGVVAVYYCIENALLRMNAGRGGGFYLKLIPVIMLLWANVHRGFILGFMIILIYLAYVSMEFLRRRTLSRRLYGSFAAYMGLALLASLVNPNIADAFVGNFIELGGPFSRWIDEFKTLREFAEYSGYEKILYVYVALFVFSLSCMAAQWRSLKPVHVFLFAGFAIAGFTTFRFSMFFLFMSLCICAPYVSRTLGERMYLNRPALWIVMLVALPLLVSGASKRNYLRLGPLEDLYLPDGAAGYIEQFRPPAPLFNAFEYGGYLGWRLYPEYKVFVDQRNLDVNVYDKYARSKGGRYREVFNEYGVNTVVFYLINPIINEIPSIVTYLMLSDEWEAVYVDRVSVVFVRKSAGATLYALDKKEIWAFMEDNARNWALVAPGDTRPYLMLAYIFVAQEEWDKAFSSYSEVLRLDPDNETALLFVKAINKYRNQQGAR